MILHSIHTGSQAAQHNSRKEFIEIFIARRENLPCRGSPLDTNSRESYILSFGFPRSWPSPAQPKSRPSSVGRAFDS